MSYIQYAAEKIESVRKLERTSVSMISCGIPVKARPFTKIVGGILTSTNTYSHTNNNKVIKNELKKHVGLRSIDFGCMADYGSFVIDYEGEEDINLKDEKDFKKRYNDYYANRVFKDIRFSKLENSLVTFFMQLTRYLQQAIGTVPAINLQAYLEKIDEEIDDEI